MHWIYATRPPFLRIRLGPSALRPEISPRLPFDKMFQMLHLASILSTFIT